MEQFLVTSDDNFDGAREYAGIDAQDAAEVFVDRNFSDLDCPSTIDVLVKDPRGVVTEWTVTVEMEPAFRATEKARATS